MVLPVGKTQTVDEWAMEFWGHLPCIAYQGNRRWLRTIIAHLSVGGTWAWPATGRTFQKIGDNTLTEVTYG
jgi:hypothetical protein